MFGYRPHLDGLRAIAVGLVLVFHAGVESFELVVVAGSETGTVTITVKNSKGHFDAGAKFDVKIVE